MKWDLQQGAEPASRIAWIDYAKGFCIILVVMMHSTLGVEAALGARSALHHVVDLSAPFRIPAFFLMSGLLLSRTIDQPWGLYLDRKVTHFAYFYLLWLAISCVVKYGAQGPGAVASNIGIGLVQPFGALWFIYVLPFFFVATKLGRSRPAVLLAAALALHLAAPQTGWDAFDEFASRYVFFLAGYLGLAQAVGIAEWAARNRGRTVLILLAGGAAAGLLHAGGFASAFAKPGVGLALGFLGSAAVIAASALLAQANRFVFIRHCGERSLPIYLSFFLPMAAVRTLIAIHAPGVGPDLAAIAVIAAALAVPFALDRMTRGNVLCFLFRRPKHLEFGHTTKTRAA